MSDDENGSDEEQQPKGNMFLAQAAMKSKMNLDDQKKLTCLGCSKDIWPNQAKEVPQTGKHYHVECFKCEVCKSRLQSGKFAALKGHFYCVPHYTELLRAAGGKVDAVVSTDRTTVEAARENARTAATNRTAGIKSAEDAGRAGNWQAAKSNAQGTVDRFKKDTAEQANEAKLATSRQNNSNAAGVRAKFAPPKPNFERTSDAAPAAKPAPAKAAAFKAPAPSASSSSSSASSAPKSGGVSAAASKFNAPKAATPAAPAKPAAKAAPPAPKAAGGVPPPGRAASPGGAGSARPASPGAARAGFKAPTPKFEVDEAEERRKKEEEEERKRKEEEERAAREEEERRAREEEEQRTREEEERRAEEERHRQEEEDRSRQQQEEEERARQEEEERARQEAEAAAAQEAPAEEAPAEEAPAEDYGGGGGDGGSEFQPVAGKRWERIEHEDGDVYFYNHETGESVWEEPPDFNE